MKKTLTLISIIGCFCLIALFFIRCEEITGSAPTNVKLEAATDSTVKITWTAPADGNPDKYIVQFKAVGGSWVDVTEPAGTATEYTDDPAGVTGDYKVVAKFGGNEYESGEVSTIPVHNAAAAVSELNATGNSGYGWGRTDGTGSSYTMTQASSAASVDFYISNWAYGYSVTPYSITSPDLAPSDSGSVVPAGSWRANGFSNAITDPNAALPRYISGTTYFNYTDIATDPIYVGVRTADEYYALVKASGVNTGAGTVQIETWFQKVKGLRLIKH